MPPPLPAPAVLAYTVAALSPNMDVANAALPTYVVVSGGLRWAGGGLAGTQIAEGVVLFGPGGRA